MQCGGRAELIKGKAMCACTPVMMLYSKSTKNQSGVFYTQTVHKNNMLVRIMQHK